MIKRCPHIFFLLTRCGSYSNVHCYWVSSFRTEELFVQLRCHVDEARVSTKDWSQVQKEDWTNCQVIRTVCLRQRPESSLDWVVKSIKRSLQVYCAKWLFLGNWPPTPPLSQHLLLLRAKLRLMEGVGVRLPRNPYWSRFHFVALLVRKQNSMWNKLSYYRQNSPPFNIRHKACMQQTSQCDIQSTDTRQQT